VSLLFCPLLGPSGGGGIQPDCFARNVDVGGFLIFQSPTLIIHVVSLVMTAIMIYNIKSKYTAVGRKEIVIFFYLFMVVTLLEFLLEGNFIQMYTSAYKWFAAIHVGMLSATFWTLLLNGFVGFQFAEDGTALSLWSIRVSAAGIGLISFIIAIVTFTSNGGLSPTNTIGLFVVYYMLNGVFLAVYVVLQIILVFNTLDDRWPFGDIAFGVFFFAAGQVVMLLLSQPLCVATNHYIDGLFFAHVFSLLAVMMVYKYWDSITKDDLEFSVGGKLNVWEVKEEAVEDEMVVPAVIGVSGPNSARESRAFGESVGVGYEKTKYGL